MVADKQLIIVVEGTADLAQNWQTIVSDYLEKIVRAFCGCESMEQVHTLNTNEVDFELQLAMFLTHGSYGPLRSGWTKHMDVFIDNLKSMQFQDGGLDGAATTIGLADALMMFAVPANGVKTEENLVGKRHCILVAATNPYPLPVIVYRPKFDDCGDSSPYHDAETVAGWFGKCSVSLSVICPRKLPKIRALYEAGKRNPDSEDPPIQNNHLDFLVLISEDFKEAQDALNSTRLVVKPERSRSNPQAGASTSHPPGTNDSSLGHLQQPSCNLQGNTNTNSSMSQKNAQQEGGLGVNLVTTTNPSSTAYVPISPESFVPGMPPTSSIPMTRGIPGYLMDESRYVVAWEGDLYCIKHGIPVFLSRLKAYINLGLTSAVVGWPNTITIINLIPQARINHEYDAAKAILLVFNVMNPHAFIQKMFQKSLSAVIHLSTQTLVLTVFEQPTHIIGMLFPKDIDTSIAPPAAPGEAASGAADAATQSQQQG